MRESQDARYCAGPNVRLPAHSRLLSLWTCILIAASPSLQAHDLFAAYIQHRVGISMGARHIDVTVQLTFFEEGSEHERTHMDANRDGRISRAESDAYLQTLEPKLAKAVTLQIGGRPVTLIPLRTPELDLLGQDGVGRGHHRLVVYYFAPVPQQLSPGMEILVENRLWPEARALGSMQVEGKEGCRLEAVPAGDPVFPPAKGAEARIFKARLLSPPNAPDRSAAGSRTNSPPTAPPLSPTYE